MESPATTYAMLNRELQMGWSSADDEQAEGRKRGLLQAANWLRGQANAEQEPKAKAAFIEAHNAILALAEGRA